MYQKLKTKFTDLEKQLLDPQIVHNPAKMKTISQEHAKLKKVMTLISRWEKTIDSIKQNEEIVRTETEPELKNMAQAETAELKQTALNLQTEINENLQVQNPNDQKNTIIEIRAGTGGNEAALFAGDLFRMYARYCEKNNWRIDILNSNALGIGGFKEIIFSVNGPSSYGRLKYEAGTHRVQRVPETEKQGRVHTSAATVVVLPEAEEVDVRIEANDVRVDTFCSSGPGGQSVNTTYSAVRLTHLPTGITVSCQDQKSQHQNKDKAMQVLRSRLLAKQEEERMQSESDTRKSQVGSGDRSDKIRTYNFPQDRVTDHRINKSWHNITRIMEGEIDEIIQALKQADK